MNEEKQELLERMLTRLKNRENYDEIMSRRLAKRVKMFSESKDALLTRIEVQNVIIEDKLGIFMDNCGEFDFENAEPLPDITSSAKLKLEQAFAFTAGLTQGVCMKIHCEIPEKVYVLNKIFGEYLDYYWPDAEYAEGRELRIAGNEDMLTLINENYDSPDVDALYGHIMSVIDAHKGITYIEQFMEQDEDTQKEILAREIILSQM